MPEETQPPSAQGGTLLSAGKLTGRRVFQGEGREQTGKVRAFVFYPGKRACAGFLVKRPDAALMFRRKDAFVAFDGFSVCADGVEVRAGEAFTGQAACERLGIDLDRCVIWQGLPILSEGGEQVGLVEDVLFSPKTGQVEWIVPGKGALSSVLLGDAAIPRSLIRGFKLGVGDRLNVPVCDDTCDEVPRGAIVVSDEACSIASEGGLAGKAGRTAAVAGDRARRAREAAKPKVAAAARATGRAVDKGAYATGRQISRAKGMFAAFKSEYDKAVADDSKQTRR